jgi:hypothetical protein
MTRVSVVVARGVGQQLAIDEWVREHCGGSRAAIVEAGVSPLTAPDDVPLVRLFAGCVCCVGHVALRVTLTRLLRVNPPDELLLLIADDAHLDRVKSLVTDGSLGARLDLA